MNEEALRLVESLEWDDVVDLAAENIPDGVDWDDITYEGIVELAATNVESYQRRTDSGKVVTVRGYVRTDHSAVTDRAKQAPGRPRVAAASGRFPGDRAIPVWPDAGKVKHPEDSLDEKAVQYEGIEDTGEVNQEGLDAEVPVMLEILPNLPSNPALNKFIGILKTLTNVSLTDDPATDLNVLELAKGIVRVTGYSYVSKKTGKVVRVDPYTQMRRLVSFLGGPVMAAKKGITPDLVDRSLPGFQMKDKVFSAKATAHKVTPNLGKLKRNYDPTDNRIDRIINIPNPKPGDNAFQRALSPTHPLEAVRVSREGSRVVRGSESWVRANDGMWYKMPRRNNRGINDRELTKRLTSKGAQIEVRQGNPVERRQYPTSKVDTSTINPRSANYADSVRYHKSLDPAIQNMPPGIADSLNGHLKVERSPANREISSFDGMVRTRATRTNNFYPDIVVRPNPEYEQDLMKSLPKQQREGYSVPSTLHPMETVMARETSVFTETLLNNRAPTDITDRMYDRLNNVYDRHVRKDGGDYIGLSGKDGWMARMTGDRSDELKGEIREKLSMSAWKSPEDFLAEAWTEYVANPEPRPIARDMGRAFQDAMEEFDDYMFRRKYADASEIPDRVVDSNIRKTPSRRVSDVIGGAEDHYRETNLAPRDLRSVLTHSSKYYDIRDDNGNPLFDAEVYREGDTASIATVSLPMVSSEDMPDPTPDIHIISRANGAYYISDPEQDWNDAILQQQVYSKYINQERALKAIEATEEVLVSEGVRKLTSQPRAGEDSIIYARAGYRFDPETTDVQEIHTMLNDLSDLLDTIDPDQKDGFFVMTPREYRSTRTKVTKLQNSVTADPETWVTPEDIANIGKKDTLDRSLGEAVLDRYSWNGVKNPDIPGDSDTYDPNVLPPVNASTIGGAARALSSDGDVRDIQRLTDSVLDRHRESFPDATSSVTGTAAQHAIHAADSDGNTLFHVDVTRNEDGSISWSNVQGQSTREGAILSFEMSDYLETTYQNAGVTALRQTPREDIEPMESYALAMQGYDWDTPPTPDELSSIMEMIIEDQMRDYETKMNNAVSLRNANNPMEEIVKAQERVRRDVEQRRESLRQQAGTLIAKYDDDPKGPMPFEVVNLGKTDTHELNQAIANTPEVRDSAPSKMLNALGPDDNPVPGVVVEKTADGRTIVHTTDLSGNSTSFEDLSEDSQKVLGNLGEFMNFTDYRRAFDLDDDPDVVMRSIEAGDPLFDVRDSGASYPTAQKLIDEGITDPSALYTMRRPSQKGASSSYVLPARLAYESEENQLLRLREGALQREGSTLQQMTSIDGDALHDSWIEFGIKNALTFGGYNMMKTMSGMWSWASNSDNPSFRKQSVGLLFILLRLLPSSVWRGAVLQVAHQLTRRISSPDPQDWPSRHEIESAIDDIRNQLPSSVLNQLGI